MNKEFDVKNSILIYWCHLYAIIRISLNRIKTGSRTIEDLRNSMKAATNRWKISSYDELPEEPITNYLDVCNYVFYFLYLKSSIIQLMALTINFITSFY